MRYRPGLRGRETTKGDGPNAIGAGTESNCGSGTREVLAAIAGGSSNRDIRRAFYRAATVKSHVSSILTKLGLRDRAQVVLFEYESGLVEAGNRDIGH